MIEKLKDWENVKDLQLPSRVSWLFKIFFLSS